MTILQKLRGMLKFQNFDEDILTQIKMPVLYFVLSFMLSSLKIYGIAAPFGIAIVALAGVGINGVFALIASLMSYLFSTGLELGIKYCAASVLTFTIIFVLQDIKLSLKPWFRPLVATLTMGLASILGTFSGDLYGISAMALIVTEMTVAGAGTYFFIEALSNDERMSESAESKHDVSLAILLACLFASLASIKLFNIISVGRVLALIIMMAMAFRGGTKVGASSGTVFGLAMDACSTYVPFFTMAYATSAMISAVFSKQGRFIYVLTYVLAHALMVLLSWQVSARIDSLFEVFCASVIFMMIPPTLLSSLCAAIMPLSRGAGESGLRRYCARRVEGIALAYEEICEIVQRASENKNDNDIAQVYDRAADIVCIKCVKKNDCWNKNFIETVDAFNMVSDEMRENGSLDIESLPKHFTEKCIKTEDLVSAINKELRELAYRESYRAKLEENRVAAWGQYIDFSDILHSLSTELMSGNGADPLAERRLVRYLRSLDIEADVSAFRDGSGRLRIIIESGKIKNLMEDKSYLDKLSEVMGVRLCRPINGGGEARLTLLEAEPLAVSVGIAAMKKEGENVSGDRGTYFKTETGMLCVILSDGMGSGKPAARESLEAVEILEKFLRSGVEPALAMKTLNSVMLLRNGDDWGFATVDLMCIDLFSGEAGFYKYGAAPSYVKNGKTIRNIKCENVAAGLTIGEGAMPDVVKMKLKPGSLALIASDGVVSGEDEWLKEMMGKFTGNDTKTLAKSVLKQAEKEYGNADDMTVLAIKMENRA